MQTRYLRAIIVIVFISGITGVTFFVSSKLSTNKSVAPNSPESQAQAYRPSTSSIKSDVDVRQFNSNSPASNPTPARTIRRDDEEPVFQSSANTLSTPTPTKVPTNAPAATPKPTTTIAENRFGYRPPDPDDKSLPAYMSKDANACDDKLGFVSGTGCDKDGNRFVINLPSTQTAYQEAVVKAKNEIANKTDEEILQIAAQNGTVCPPADYACQEDAITTTTNKLLIDNAVVIPKDIEELRKARENNQLIKDVVSLPEPEFRNKYYTDRATALANNKIDNSINLAVAGNLLAAYIDPNTTIATLINIACSGSYNSECRNEMSNLNREQILKNVVGNNVTAEYLTETIKQYKNEEKATKYIIQVAGVGAAPERVWSVEVVSCFVS